MEHVEFVNAVISALGVLGMWLILRPQKVENEALHKSIDNNTKAMQELRSLINDIRVEQAAVETNITNLWHRCKELKAEIDALHVPSQVPCEHCKGGDRNVR